MISRRKFIRGFGAAIALAAIPSLPVPEVPLREEVYKGFVTKEGAVVYAPYIPSFTITRTKVIAKSRKLKYVGR